MEQGYYCDHCQKFILAEISRFNHPHEGIRTCYRCRKCGGMVYLKERPRLEVSMGF